LPLGWRGLHAVVRTRAGFNDLHLRSLFSRFCFILLVPRSRANFLIGWLFLMDSPSVRYHRPASSFRLHPFSTSCYLAGPRGRYESPFFLFLIILLLFSSDAAPRRPPTPSEYPWNAVSSRIGEVLSAFLAFPDDCGSPDRKPPLHSCLGLLLIPPHLEPPAGGGKTVLVPGSRVRTASSD